MDHQVKRLPKRDLDIGRLLYPETVVRPKKRSECKDGVRPCPYVSCRYHLYLSVSEQGIIKFEHAGEVWDMGESCALDVADRGDHTREDVGEYMGFGKERARQVEESALERLREMIRGAELETEIDTGRAGPEHQRPPSRGREREGGDRPEEVQEASPDPG